jgi:hypothetical protein
LVTQFPQITLATENKFPKPEIQTNTNAFLYLLCELKKLCAIKLIKLFYHHFNLLTKELLFISCFHWISNRMWWSAVSKTSLENFVIFGRLEEFREWMYLLIEDYHWFHILFWKDELHIGNDSLSDQRINILQLLISSKLLQGISELKFPSISLFLFFILTPFSI